MTNLIAKHGGYKNLKSFQNAEIVHDFTVEFCKRYVPSFKLAEQMEGAARGGKQNIGEGSQTSGTSRQSELRLVMVARASQEELLIDYMDFLRRNGLPQWGKDDSRAQAIRKLAYTTNRSYSSYRIYMTNKETAANCAICLIKQTTYLLDQQIKALEKELLHQGDFKERFTAARNEAKKGEMAGSSGPSQDEFLAAFKLKRQEDGRVIRLEDSEAG